jgi:hypothetical protein
MIVVYKIDFKEIGCDSVNWIQLAHDKDHRLGFLREEQS